MLLLIQKSIYGLKTPPLGNNIGNITFTWNNVLENIHAQNSS